MMEDGRGFTLVPGSTPSTLNSASGLETLGWNFGRKCSPGINQRQTLILVRKSTLEHYDVLEKIAFLRKRLSIAATNRQRSPEIVATATVGEVTAMKPRRTADS